MIRALLLVVALLDAEDAWLCKAERVEFRRWEPGKPAFCYVVFDSWFGAERSPWDYDTCYCTNADSYQ